jgi:hypothetical protein
VKLLTEDPSVFSRAADVVGGMYKHHLKAAPKLAAGYATGGVKGLAKASIDAGTSMPQDAYHGYKLWKKSGEKKSGQKQEQLRLAGIAPQRPSLSDVREDSEEDGEHSELDKKASELHHQGGELVTKSSHTNDVGDAKMHRAASIAHMKHAKALADFGREALKKGEHHAAHWAAKQAAHHMQHAVNHATAGAPGTRAQHDAEMNLARAKDVVSKFEPSKEKDSDSE